MLPYPNNPQEQQQVVTMPPPGYPQQQLNPANGALHPGQQHVFIQAHPTQQGAVRRGQARRVPKHPRYQVKASRILGIMQLILATISAIFGIITAVASASGSWLGMTIWTAVFFYLPAGVLAIVSTIPTKSQTCLINACLGMSIVSDCFSLGCVIYSIINATQEFSDEGGFYLYYTDRIAYWSVLAVVSFGEFVVATIQAIYCCYATRHGTTNAATVQNANQVQYTVPQQQNPAHPQAAYPMQQQQYIMQQQLPQQQIVHQQQQMMQQQQQQPIPSYGVQNVTLVQSAPPDEQNEPVIATAPDEKTDLHENRNSPPPSYNLENAI